MWPCRSLLALLTRSTPCLRAVRRSKGLKRLRRKASAAPPSSSPPSSTHSTASAAAVPQKPPATRSPAASPSPPSHNTAATAAATSPLSAPGSPAPPASALSLAALATAVEHLKEFSRRTQHTLRTQDEALQLLQQRFTLLQQQVGQLEGVADGLRGKLTEVHRSVGEMVMGQRNTDLLVQQMERQLLTLRTPTTTAAAGVSKPSQEPGEGSARESEGAQSAAAAAKTPTTTPASPAPVAASTEPSNAPQPAQPQQASSLSQQVAQLEARVNQLVLEMFTADRLLSAASAASVTARLAALLSSCSTAAKRAAVMEALHQQHAVHTFTDATGATRVTSQCVRLHNVPLNLGAAEVRELCVQHVCQGDSSGFVSCVVRRHPPPMLPQEAAAAAAQQCPQPQQRQGGAEYVSRAGSSSATTNATTAAAASAATVGALPRGDAVGALRPNTKSFEVVFASSALAVEALRVLNGLQLKPTMHSEAVPLAVEPVVSADVLSTLNQMEAAAEKEA